MITKHLFFTGEMGVGKSTLIRKILRQAKGPVGGFFTVKAEDLFPGQPSLHLLSLKQTLVPSKENFLTFCGEKNEETAAMFNKLGCGALSDTRDLELLIMDELGPHEANALLFQRAVIRALDGPVPILGVLQKADSPFLSEIRAHPKVAVVEVTRQNREQLETEFLTKKII